MQSRPILTLLLVLIILILLLSSSVLHAQVRYPVDSIPVTYVSGGTNERSRKMIERRIQTDIDGYSASLKATHLTSLPKQIRKTYLVQVTDEGRRSVIRNNRHDIAKRIKSELLSLPWDSTAKSKKLIRDKFTKRFIAGNFAGKDYVDHWFTLMEDSLVVPDARSRTSISDFEFLISD